MKKVCFRVLNARYKHVQETKYETQEMKTTRVLSLNPNQGFGRKQQFERSCITLVMPQTIIDPRKQQLICSLTVTPVMLNKEEEINLK